MNYSIGIFAVLFLAMANLKQSDLQFNVSEPKEKLVETISEEPTDFQITEDMISINPIRGNYTVKVGQQIYYSASVHGSVGYSAEVYAIGDGLQLSHQFTEYENEQKAGLCGGDSATEYFVFDVTKVGTYEVIAERYFRGDLENEYTITISCIE